MGKFFLIFFLIADVLFAQDFSPGDRDPLAHINYPEAFNLLKIQKKFRKLLSELGCAKNIFPDEDEYSFRSRNAEKAEYLLIEMPSLDSDVDDEKLKQQFKDYHEACIKHLNSQRRAILLRPAKESVIMMSLMTGASGALVLMAGSNSFGGSFGIFATMFNSAFYIRDIIRASYNWCYTPPHPVDDLEIDYVKNQCFIPKAIWPKIMQKFMLARSNQFEQQDALHFIEFALGLTVFKAKNTLPVLNSMHLKKLSEKIDDFFKNYENVDVKDNHLPKVNVKRFLDQLSGHAVAPRYLYLVGPLAKPILRVNSFHGSKRFFPMQHIWKK